MLCHSVASVTCLCNWWERRADKLTREREREREKKETLTQSSVDDSPDVTLVTGEGSFLSEGKKEKNGLKREENGALETKNKLTASGR